MAAVKHYAILEHVGAVLNELYKTCGFYRVHARTEGNIVYGSLIWRIIKHVTIAERTTENVNHSAVLKSVVEEIQQMGSDIDMFVTADTRIGASDLSDVSDEPDAPGGPSGRGRGGRHAGRGRGGRFRQSCYGWLAYRHERRIIENTKVMMAKRLQECKYAATFGSAMMKTIKQNNRSMRLDIETLTIDQPVYGFQIKFQVHRSPSGIPAELLDATVAPFFTVETLMWVSGDGIKARFGVSQDTVLRHIHDRELHLVCPDELSEHLDGNLHMSSNMQMLRQRLMGRLMKYKKYGFTLCFDRDEIRCTSIPEMISDLMRLHVMDRNRVQKRLISQGIRIATADEEDEEFIKMSDNAWAAQSLHNDYNTSVAGVVTGSPTEVCQLIAAYAARSNEEAYWEDPQWQAEVEVARDALARVLMNAP